MSKRFVKITNSASSQILKSIKQKKTIDEKLKLMENRIKNLKREERKAEWKIQQATQKEELFK